MFPCGICEIYKNTYFEEHLRRLLLKPVLSPGLPFLITYTTGSNWYLCFSFYIIIYSFVCQFCLHYYWYCYNQKQSYKSYKFRKIHKKTVALKTRFSEVADLQSFTISKKRFWGRFFLVNFAKFLRTHFF